MQVLRLSAWLLFALAGLFALPPASGAMADESADDIVIGILAHRGEEIAEARWRETITYLDDAVPGRKVRATMLTLAGTKASLDGNELDFLLTNPGHYSILAGDHGLSPIASLRTDRAGQPKTGNRYGAVIFTRSGHDDIRNLADLTGRTFAAVAPDAFGGFLMAADTLTRNGIDPWKDLAEIRYLGFPQDRIVEAVLDGEVDAGTVRTGLLETMMKDGRLQAGAVQIINPQRIPGFELALSTEVFPEWIFAATAKSDEQTRRQFAIALLSIAETLPAAVTGRYSGWTTYVPSPSIDGALGLLNRSRPDPAFAGQGLLRTSTLALAALAGFGLLMAGQYLFARRSRHTVSEIASEFRPDDIHLTPREGEVLCLIETGRTTKEIARELGISPKTVEYHRSHLMQKFEASNVAELVHKAGLPNTNGPMRPAKASTV